MTYRKPLSGDRLRRHGYYIALARRRYTRQLERLARFRWLR